MVDDVGELWRLAPLLLPWTSSILTLLRNVVGAGGDPAKICSEGVLDDVCRDLGVLEPDTRSLVSAIGVSSVCFDDEGIPRELLG